MTLNISGLNPRQREAVLHSEGPLLILAGAGTGKTRTLAYRIASLVDRGVPAEDILAVAFTNKSADELRDRVRRVLGWAVYSLEAGVHRLPCQSRYSAASAVGTSSLEAGEGEGKEVTS